MNKVCKPYIKFCKCQLNDFSIWDPEYPFSKVFGSKRSTYWPDVPVGVYTITVERLVRRLAGQAALVTSQLTSSPGVRGAWVIRVSGAAALTRHPGLVTQVTVAWEGADGVGAESVGATVFIQKIIVWTLVNIRTSFAKNKMIKDAQLLRSCFCHQRQRFKTSGFNQKASQTKCRYLCLPAMAQNGLDCTDTGIQYC